MKARLIKETDAKGKESWRIQTQEYGYQTWEHIPGSLCYDALSAEMIWQKFQQTATIGIVEVIEEVQL